MAMHIAGVKLEMGREGEREGVTSRATCSCCGGCCGCG